MRTDIEVEVILNKEEMELVLGFSAPAVWDQPRSKESEFKEFQYKGETYFFLVTNGTLHIFDCAGDEEFSVQYKSVDEPATDVLHLLMNAYAKGLNDGEKHGKWKLQRELRELLDVPMKH